MKNTKLQKLCVCAIMIALSTVLSLVKIWTMPLGGSLTLLSMLPVCFISIYYGLGAGFASAFVYSLIQLALDIPAAMSWGMDARMWAGCVAFDYIIAFTILGIAGIFRKKGYGGIIAGTVLACVLRFVSHVISGTIFFDIWMPEGWSNPFIYAICYNGAFMLPEVILTSVGAFFVYKAFMNHAKIKIQ